MKKCGIGLSVVFCALALLLFPVRTQAAERVEIKESDYDSFRAVFNAEYYYNAYGDLQAAIGYDEEGLFRHFISYGIFEGRTGDGEFCFRTYMESYTDLQAAFGADYGAYCRHYIEYGRDEGRTAAVKDMEGVIGSYTTEYDPSEQRAINVELAASKVNGTVLQPGQRFSFSAAASPISLSGGYVMGPAFSGGRVVEGVGGGLCQVSSTLYSALVVSGVPVTQRYPHSLPVDYVPRGMDATIAGNSKDLRFVNSFSYPIEITAVTEDGKLTVSLKPYDMGAE
ncbi:MAG: VanW family protein [Lachnospiraceae bacterium]|nr:VanW family protein [Lachnospiraceae bacterium]